MTSESRMFHVDRCLIFCPPPSCLAALTLFMPPHRTVWMFWLTDLTSMSIADVERWWSILTININKVCSKTWAKESISRLASIDILLEISITRPTFARAFRVCPAAPG